MLARASAVLPRGLAAVRVAAVRSAPAAAAAAAAAPARLFAAAAGKKGAKPPQDLASVLQRELAYEKAENASAGDIASAKESLKEWTISDVAGTSRVTLAKKASFASRSKAGKHVCLPTPRAAGAHPTASRTLRGAVCLEY
jgi:hypothetical protein